MTNSFMLPVRHEYDITVENITLRLLITDLDDENSSGSPAYNEHTHAYCELFICKEGSITIITEETELTLSAGMLAFVPAGIPHFCQNECSRCWVSIGLIACRRRISGVKNIYGILSRLLNGASVRILTADETITDTVFRIGMDEDADPVRTPLTMLMKLVELAEGINSTTDIPLPPISSRFDINRIAQLEQIIDGNYQQELTLGVTAEKLYLSKSQLTRFVRARYGTTFHKIILARRLDAAKKLLAESTLSIERIGSSVGFRSKSSFYRSFRKRYGMTPAEYRGKITARQ